MMTNNNVQTLYINIDDSGKISLKEDVAIYGGIIFFEKSEKDKFITQYRSIIHSMKCKYCKNNIENCNQNCPELKHSNLKSTDKRRLLNYIKKYVIFSCIIDNNQLYQSIIRDKASKGRYNDYAIRRLIKGLLLKLVKEHKIDPNLPVKIILNIDEQSTKTNGYYNLKDGLTEELRYGIKNFNYEKVYKPVFHNDFDIMLTYLKSDKSFVVQAADLIAGMTRANAIKYINNRQDLSQSLNFVYYIIFLPKEKER